MKIITFVFLICSIIGLSSCSSVKFYEINTNDGTETESGFLYYPPKPYLLVEMIDKNITSKIISLPDTTRPHVVKQIAGWGTSDLSFTIKDGMIETFNSKSDSKGPEAITSVAGLGSAQAAIVTAKAAETLAEFTVSSGGLESIRSDSSERKLPLKMTYEIVAFKNSAEVIENNVIKQLKTERSTFNGKIKTLNSVLLTIKENIDINYLSLNPDTLLEQVETRRKLARKLTISLSNISSALAIYADNEAEAANLVFPANEANTYLEKAIDELTAFSLRSSTVTGLYEIKYINGHLQLDKVVLDR